MISTFGIDGLGDLDQRGAPGAATDGADDHVHIGQVLEDLQPHGAQAVQDLGFVALLHVVVAGGVDQFVTVGLGIVEVVPMHDEVGAEALDDAVDLGIVVLGHHHGAGHVEPASRPSHGKPVVAAGGDQHAALQLFPRHVVEEVESAPDLERTGGVVVLVLDEDLAAHQARKLRVVDEVRAVEIAADDPTGLDDPEQIDVAAECLVVPQHRPSKLEAAKKRDVILLPP